MAGRFVGVDRMRAPSCKVQTTHVNNIYSEDRQRQFIYETVVGDLSNKD